jgi:hypothetical protein
MIITNKYNLPEPFVDAIKNDPYSKGDANISVTGLISPPQMRHLVEKHDHEIVVDVSDRMAALYGQAMHIVAERAAFNKPNLLTEKTLYTHYLGWKIKGQFDSVMIAEGILLDIKTCAAHKVSDGKTPEEWVQQTNIYKRMLQKEKGLVINSIRIAVSIRDFSKRLARTKSNYPPAPGFTMDIPVWDDDAIDDFIEQRIRLHQAAEPQSCSEKDIWARSPSWAVMKRGNVRAVRVFDNPGEAEQFASSSVALYVEHRPGEAIRCLDYCDAAPFCPQWAVDPRNKSIPSIEEELFGAKAL